MTIPQPLWIAKPETASRVRGRCEQIWDAAKVQKLCGGENPFDWKTLKHLLPAKSEIHKVEHHAAVPHREISGIDGKASCRQQCERTRFGVCDFVCQQGHRGSACGRLRI
jgi:hypothetical protein